MRQPASQWVNCLAIAFGGLALLLPQINPYFTYTFPHVNSDFGNPNPIIKHFSLPSICHGLCRPYTVTLSVSFGKVCANISSDICLTAYNVGIPY